MFKTCVTSLTANWHWVQAAKLAVRVRELEAQRDAAAAAAAEAGAGGSVGGNCSSELQMLMELEELRIRLEVCESERDNLKATSGARQERLLEAEAMREDISSTQQVALPLPL